eukprot:2366279-Prymnesium_polylepis.2
MRNRLSEFARARHMRRTRARDPQSGMARVNYMQARRTGTYRKCVTRRPVCQPRAAGRTARLLASRAWPRELNHPAGTVLIKLSAVEADSHCIIS